MVSKKNSTKNERKNTIHKKRGRSVGVHQQLLADASLRSQSHKNNNNNLLIALREQFPVFIHFFCFFSPSPTQIYDIKYVVDPFLFDNSDLTPQLEVDQHYVTIRHILDPPPQWENWRRKVPRKHKLDRVIVQLLETTFIEFPEKGYLKKQLQKYPEITSTEHKVYTQNYLKNDLCVRNPPRPSPENAG